VNSFDYYSNVKFKDMVSVSVNPFGYYGSVKFKLSGSNVNPFGYYGSVNFKDVPSVQAFHFS
jgi:hypothetical protein